MKIAAAKQEIRQWFSDPPAGHGRIVEAVIVGLILVVSALPAVRSYVTNPTSLSIIDGIETTITVLFLIEYLLRLWVAPRKLAHVANPYSIIDLIAILPLFLPGTYLQLIRIFRLLRILRLARYLKSPRFFFGSMTRKTLILVRIIFTVSAIIFVSAGLVYYAEHDANHQVFRTFADALYFSIVTMATVGYGDITPITIWGRWVTVLIIFAGIILLPWQIKDFIEQMLITHAKVGIECPACGLTPHESNARFCRRCGARLPSPDDPAP
ncbi:MAG: ion transporter [Deltaproteobacteria bacterium]|nr:ion transporter [Deltaproteobacteria bacterium]